MLSVLSLALAADGVPAVPVDGQLYRAPLDAQATLWADDASLHPGLRAGATVGWVHEPVVWVWQDTGERVPLVADAVGVDLLAAYTFWRLRAGLDVPLYPFASGNAGSGGGAGDIALDVKGVVLESGKAPVGLAIGFRAELPTGTTVVPLASGGFAYELTLIADKKFGPVLVAANLGTRGAPTVDASSVSVGDAFSWRLGAGYDPDGRWGASLDLAGYSSWSDFGNPAGAPSELMLGGWVAATEAVRVSLGVGHGISSGIGASNGRAVLGVQWAPAAKTEPKPAVVAAKPEPAPKPPPAPKPTPAAKPPPPPPTAPLAKATPPAPAPAPPPPPTAPLAKATPPAPAPPPPPTAPLAKATPPAPAPAPPPPPTAPLATATPPTPAPAPAVLAPPAPPPVVVAPVVAVPTAQNPVVVAAGRLVLFHKVSFAGTALDAEGTRMLDAIATYLGAHPELEHLRVEGHTSGTGDPSEELGIAGARAGVVLDYLEKKGLERSRFTAAGYGAMRPLVPVTDPTAATVNERIELVITKWTPGSEPPK